jgi:hypothetical protein
VQVVVLDSQEATLDDEGCRLVEELGGPATRRPRTLDQGLGDLLVHGGLLQPAHDHRIAPTAAPVQG